MLDDLILDLATTHWSAEQYGKLDAACDRFERAWQHGQPLIEEYLAEANPHERAVWFKHLMQLEFEIRRMRAEPLGRDAYEARFPNERSLIQILFEHFESPANASSMIAGLQVERTRSSKISRATEPQQILKELEYSSRFEDFQYLASGGMGEIWVARDTSVGRRVAIKIASDRQASSKTGRQQFLAEAEITSLLEHPGITPVFGTGNVSDGRPCYAMRFVEGELFSSAIGLFHGTTTQLQLDDSKRNTQFRNLLQQFSLVCKTIAFAHDRGYVHCDLKPANIRLGKFGEVVVLDWGLAKPIEGTSLKGAARSMGISFHGTPQFMSPEQASGGSNAHQPATDIYALGSTLYFLLTGTVPFEGSTVHEVVEKKKRGDFLPPIARRSDLSKSLNSICLKAMAMDPLDRYASALELSADIERWMADEPVSVSRESLFQRGWRWIRKHRSWFYAGLTGSVLLAICMLAILMIVTISNRRLAVVNNNLKQLNASQQIAHREANQARARLALDRGTMLCDQELLEDGLLWYCEGIRVAQLAGDKNLEAAARYNISAWSPHFRSVQQSLNHADILTCFAVGRDGKTWFSGGIEGDLKAWDSVTGNSLWQHRFAAPVTSIAVQSNRIWVGTGVDTAGSGSVHQIELETGELRGSKEYAAMVTALDSVNDDSLLIATIDGTLYWMDAEKNKILREWQLHEPIHCVAFTRDAKRCAAGAEHSAQVFELESAEPVQTIPHQKRIRSIAFNQRDFNSPDLWLATGCQDCFARIFNRDGELVSQFSHGGYVLSLQFDSKSERLFTTTGDRLARVWNLSTQRLDERPLKHNGWAKAVCYQEEEDRIITASSDGMMRSFGRRANLEPLPPMRVGKGLRIATWHPVRPWIALSGIDRTSLMVDIRTREERDIPRRSKLDVWNGKFSPDGRYLALASGELANASDQLKTEGMLEVFRVHGESPSPSLDLLGSIPFDMPALSVAWLADSQSLVVGLGDTGRRSGQIAWLPISDVEIGRVRLGNLLDQPDAVWALASDPQGTDLVAGRWDGIATVLNQELSSEVPILVRPKNVWVLAASFQPKTQGLIATGDLTGQVRFWDRGQYREKPIALRHESSIEDIRFSNSGDLVATASGDSSGRLWHVDSGILIGPRNRFAAQVLRVDFAPRDPWYTIASEGGEVQFYFVPNAKVGSAEELTREMEIATHRKLEADGTTRLLESREWQDRKNRSFEKY